MYKFQTYSLRKVAPGDGAQLRAWLAADPTHAGRIAPEFFLEQAPGREALVLLDQDSEAVFYFHLSRALRLHLQFPPVECHEQRARLARAMLATLGWIGEQAPRAGFRQLVFDSQAPDLVKFCEQRLGFQRAPHDLIHNLAAPQPPQPGK